MSITILVVLVILSSAITIWAEYHRFRRYIYIFKPLTMIFIWLIALLGQATSPFYKMMILAGLVSSMVGDVLLILPSDQFVAGLGAFLVAHLFYLMAFVSEIRTPLWWPFIPLIAYGMGIYAVLAPSLGKLKWPLLFYITVILMMIWSAWGRGIQVEQTGALLAFVGAVLFVISDSILALARFRKEFKLACVLILVTYFAAQCLIASSVGALP